MNNKFNLENISKRVIKAAGKPLGFIYNSRIVVFFRNIGLELKKVDWLSRSLTIKYTVLIVICLVLGTLFVMFADQIFIQIRSLLI